MPRRSPTQTFKELLRSRFPEAESLAVERFISGPPALCDTSNHKFHQPKELTLAALYFYHAKAHRAGVKPRLTKDEAKLWGQRFA